MSEAPESLIVLATARDERCFLSLQQLLEQPFDWLFPIRKIDTAEGLALMEHACNLSHWRCINLTSLGISQMGTHPLGSAFPLREHVG